MRRLREKYGDERRTQIVTEEGDIGYEDTIEQKDMVITISHAGYIKRQEISAYRSQRRGGKGVIGARTKEEDFIEHLFVANTHAYLLILTDRGPLLTGSRCTRSIRPGAWRAAARSSTTSKDWSATSACRPSLPVKEFDDEHYLVCATRKGLIKKTVLSAYGQSAPRGHQRDPARGR